MEFRGALTRGVRRRDVVLTAVILVLCLVQVLWVVPLGGPARSLVYTFLFVVPLAWRRARPELAAFVAASSAWIPVVDAYLFLGYVVVIVLFFSLGRWTTSWLWSGLAVAYALAAGTVGTLMGPEDPVPGLLGAWLVVTAPYLIGRLMAAQEQEAADRLEAERQATRLQAVTDERARIVRELHDVVGHEVTLMSIQSEAAAQALALAPERAAEPVAAVRETAHRANRELRAILDLLGDGELPVAADRRGLAELCDRAARLGIPNTLDVSGEPWPDAPRHWLAVNRIVQESLTNAGKHAAGAPVRITVAWSPDEVRLRVSNPAGNEPAGTGRGLHGMAERARSLGGALTAGPEDVDFVVSAALPAPREEWR